MPIDAMSGALHVVLWSQERVQWLRRCGDDGPLEVIFGGPHISQPSLAKIRIGDVICPVWVKEGQLHVLGALRVQRILAPETYLMERWGFQRERGMTWSNVRNSAEGRRFGHRVPHLRRPGRGGHRHDVAMGPPGVRHLLTPRRPFRVDRSTRDQGVSLDFRAFRCVRL